MDILKYLREKKIIPSKEVIIKQQARKLAKQVSKPEYFLVKLDNKDLVEFTNQFVESILDILTERFVAATDEARNTEEAINNLKCNK